MDECSWHSTSDCTFQRLENKVNFQKTKSLYQLILFSFISSKYIKIHMNITFIINGMI